MNAFNSPFSEEGANINIDKLAQQMAQTLKKLNQIKQKPIHSQKLEGSDNSLGSLPSKFKNSVGCELNVQQIKRQNALKIRPVPCRKLRTTSECEVNNDDSQFIDSISNRKITQYAGNLNRKIVYVKNAKQTHKNQSSNQDNKLQDESHSHPVIKALKQKIAKKQKQIYQISQQTQKIRQKNQKCLQTHKLKRQTQMNQLFQLMSRNYDQKIYLQKFNQIQRKQDQHSCHVARIKLAQVVQKLQLLKNQKNGRKIIKNKVIYEQSHSLQMYGQQRQSYLTAWKKKLQNQKIALQKQVQKSSLCEYPQSYKQKYYALPQFCLDSTQNRLIFQKVYYPLYKRDQSDYFQQIRVLNMSNLEQQNILIISYPKLMKKQRKIEVKSYVKQIANRYIKLNDENFNSVFTNYTLFSQIQTLSQQYMVIGRLVWDQTPINFKKMLKRYQCLPENIAKYIVKSIIRAHQKIRRQLNHQCIILPQNLLFNQRNQIKIDRWMQNQILRFQQYSELLSKDSKYLYFPPQYKTLLYSDNEKSANMGIWTVGVMFFQMLFGKKPFQYIQNIDHDEFYYMNQLEFPSKPQVLEGCKQMLKLLLGRPLNRITFQKALKHPYFDFKK